MEKRILNRSRIRTVHGGFAFIPHRFLNDGFMKCLSQSELLLYLFLIMVSDAYGLSYYGNSAICRLLKISLPELERCRQILIDADLILFEAPLYQVLELPVKPLEEDRAIDSRPSTSPSSFAELIQILGD